LSVRRCVEYRFLKSENSWIGRSIRRESERVERLLYRTERFEDLSTGGLMSNERRAGSPRMNLVLTVPMTVLSCQQTAVPSSSTLQSPEVSALTTTTVSMTLSTFPNLAISAASSILIVSGKVGSGSANSCSVFGAVRDPDPPIPESESPSSSPESAAAAGLRRFRFDFFD
jgi:hypothetical protein